MRRVIALVSFSVVTAFSASAEEIGSVDTVFKLFGPDHKIVVEAYDDPGVTGVTCYMSRAKTGGIKGAFGLAEDKSEASIACASCAWSTRSATRWCTSRIRIA